MSTNPKFNRRAFHGLSLAVLATAGGVVGCTPPVETPTQGTTGPAGSPDDSGGSKPSQLQMLYATAEANAAAVQAILPKFKEQHGIDIHIDTQPYDALQQKVFAEFASSSSYYDIIIVDTPWAPALVKHLEPLDDYIDNASFNDTANVQVDDFIPKVFFDTAVYNASAPNKHYSGDSESAPKIADIQAAGYAVYGLPIQANAQIMAYRKDMFEDPAEQRAFKAEYGRELAVPTTWDQFLEVAKFFTRPDEDLYGTTVMAGVGDWATDDYKSMLAAWGGDGHLVTDDLELSLASPEGVAALQFYTDMINKHKVVPPGSTSASWDEAASLFGTGTTAMTMNYHSLELTGDAAAGEIAYAVVPRQTSIGPHFGTWMLSVNSNSANKEWAYRAAAWLTSSDQQLAMTENGIHPSRKSVYSAVASSDKDQAVKDFYAVLGESLAVGVGRARLTNYMEVSNEVAKAVNLAANGSRSPQEALESAAEQVKRLLTEAGYDVP